MTSFQQRIHGVIPALLTPLQEDFSVDAGAMQRLTRRVLDGGCHGVVVLGTTGEFASIDDDQRAVAIRAAIEAAAGAVPVIVACGQPNPRRTLDQLAEASDLGADGVLVNPPFYFSLSSDEIVRHFEAVVAASPLPVLLYNIPRLTKVATDAATLLRLRDVGVQGTKDSSGDIGNMMDYLAATRDDPAFRIIVGGDVVFLHALDSGVHATTGMTPNLAPRLNMDIYDAWRAGDRDAAVEAQRCCNAFLPVFASQLEFAHATAKGVLSLLGVIQKWVAPPKTSASEAEIDAAMEALREFLPEHQTATAAA